MIGVDPSTLSREVRRDGMTCETYCYVRAQSDADSQEWHGYRVPDELLALAEEKVREEQWSPEQISLSFACHGIGSISHETIYQRIYHDKRKGGDLHNIYATGVNPTASEV